MKEKEEETQPKGGGRELLQRKNLVSKAKYCEEILKRTKSGRNGVRGGMGGDEQFSRMTVSLLAN